MRLERLKMELQRKTQEYNELHTKYIEVLNLAKQNADANEYCLRDLEEENAKLKTECEKLKKQNTEMYKELEWFRDKAVTELKRSVKIIKIDEGENDNYKQALDEIEGIIKEINGSDVLTFPDLSLQENAKVIMRQCNKGYKQILDIIRKAKGEE